MKQSLEEHVVQPPHPPDEEHEAPLDSLRDLLARSRTGATGQVLPKNQHLQQTTRQTVVVLKINSVP